MSFHDLKILSNINKHGIQGSTGDSEGEPMELGEEQGESPFLQLALAGEAGESDGEEEGDVEEEGTAAGVESIKVKQEALEEEETEPQKWCVHIHYKYMYSQEPLVAHVF